jgi:hypothetical protein
MMSGTTASADSKQTNYFIQVNKLLDMMQKKYPNSKGFKAGRVIYKTPGLANSVVVDLKSLCSLYKSAYSDTKLTNFELDGIVQKYWVGEKQMVDLVLSNSGNDKTALGDFMVVRFTALLEGVNEYCPKYYALTSKQFSDRLYSVYTNYVNSVP